MHRTGSNETALVSEFPYIINDEHVIIASGPRKKPVFILSDEFCEEHLFIFFQRVNLATKLLLLLEPLSVARYFNQRLLKFSLYFASDAD